MAKISSKSQVLKHYVMILYPHSTNAHELKKEFYEISQRTLTVIPFRKGACGFYFFDRITPHPKLSLQKSYVTNISQTTWIGKILIANQIQASHPTTYKYMQEYNFNSMLETPSGKLYNIPPNDSVISPSAIIQAKQYSANTLNIASLR